MKQPKLPPKNVAIPNEDLIKYCEEWGLLEQAARLKVDPPPNDFRFDGASGTPEVISVLIDEAAFPHDVKYYIGGTNDERMVADLELAVDCIRVCGRSAGEAKAVLDLVRIGGVSWLPTPWKWGFGWPA